MALALIGLTYLVALSAIPIVTAVSDPTISCTVPGCDFQTLGPSQTVNIGLTVAWTGLTSTDTYCVFTTSTLQSSCPATGLTNSNGFLLSGTAEYSTFVLGSSSGSQGVTLTAQAPSTSGSTSFYVEACDLTQTTNACSASFEASLSMTLVQTPEFALSVILVAAVALFGVLLVRRQSLKAPTVKAL